MGVRVILDDEDDDCSSTCTSTTTTTTTSAKCYACGASHDHHNKMNDYGNCTTSPTITVTSAPTTMPKIPKTIPTSATTPTTHIHEKETEVLSAHNYQRISKDLIGNCKEFRIENNKYDLRIIGNGNRVRIGQNVGNLQIIGNSTRLKINCNSGRIKYTGNDGRICLGSESTQQLVDYIGCNGLLKIINAMELCTAQGGDAKYGKKSAKCPKKSATEMPTTTTTKNGNGSATKTKPKSNMQMPNIMKSASYGGSEETPNKQWTHFERQFQKQQRHWSKMFGNMSLPNLKGNFPNGNATTTSSKHCDCTCGKCHKQQSKTEQHQQQQQQQHINIVNNVGNIVIKNAINVSI